jgi:hypothetical protein
MATPEVAFRPMHRASAVRHPCRMTHADPKSRISTLWIVVLFNMVFADILNFISGNVDVAEVAPGLLLVFAVLLEIPIAMVFLSRTLNPSANRTANLAACVVTTLFTIAGGTPNLHYAFFAAMEVAGMILIARLAWKSL